MRRGFCEIAGTRSVWNASALISKYIETSSVEPKASTSSADEVIEETLKEDEDEVVEGGLRGRVTEVEPEVEIVEAPKESVKRPRKKVKSEAESVSTAGVAMMYDQSGKVLMSKDEFEIKKLELEMRKVAAKEKEVEVKLQEMKLKRSRSEVGFTSD